MAVFVHFLMRAVEQNCHLKAYKILFGKPAGKRSLGRSRSRWEDSINVDLGEVGFR
jgi:hypothetical protein